jgi:hypothetical protein
MTRGQDSVGAYFFQGSVKNLQVQMKIDFHFSWFALGWGSISISISIIKALQKVGKQISEIFHTDGYEEAITSHVNHPRDREIAVCVADGI